MIPLIYFSVYVPILQYIYLIIFNSIWFSLDSSVLYWIELILRVSDRSPGRWVIVFWLKKETKNDIYSDVIVSKRIFGKSLCTFTFLHHNFHQLRRNLHSLHPSPHTTVCCHPHQLENNMKGNRIHTWRWLHITIKNLF